MLPCKAADVIGERFHYLRAESPITDPVSRATSPKSSATPPTFTVVDGVTEGMARTARPAVQQKTAPPRAKLPIAISRQGPAVVSLDHATKSLTAAAGTPSAPSTNSTDSTAAPTCSTTASRSASAERQIHHQDAKDRPGQLRRHGLRSSGGLHWFGDLILDSKDETFAELEIEAPHGLEPNWRPTELMHRIADALTEHGPLAQRRILAAVTGKTDTKRAALDYLILDGYVTEKTPHELIKPYSGGAST